MKRREFLKTLGGAGLSIPGLLTASACAPVVVQSDPASGLSLGYISGDVSAESALVWLRADAGSRVSLQFGVDPGFNKFASTTAVAVEPSADDCVQIPLNNLIPATRYFYRAWVSGKTPGPVGSFVTAPRAADNAKVSFCFSGDTRESYQPFSIMRAVQARRPDFFLHLGDRKSTRLNSSHIQKSRMPSSA